MPNNAVWAVVIIGGVIFVAWLGHWYSNRPSSPSAEVQAKCQARATEVLKKVGNYKFRKTAHIDYIDANDAEHQKIGLVVLAQEPRGGKVTLEGTRYARLPNMTGEYVADYNVDMSKHSSYTSTKEFFEGICTVDPGSQWILQDPSAIQAELKKFGKRP